MKPCKDRESLLMLHLDGELAEQEGLKLKSHLEVCSDCSAFVLRQQRLQALIQGTSESRSPGEGEDFVRRVRQRIARVRNEKPGTSHGSITAAVSPSRTSWVHRAAIFAAATAAVFLFIWGFHGIQRSQECVTPAPFDPDEHLAASDSQAGIDKGSGPGIPDAARVGVHDELREILKGLQSTPNELLVRQFEERTLGLQKAGWQVKQMVQSFLGSDSGPALLTAIRLVGCDPDYNRIPGVIPSLKSLLKSDGYCMEALNALAALDDPRVDALIADMLDYPVWRDAALAHLEKRKSGDGARRIAQAVLESEDPDQDEPSPFLSAALLALSHMGPDGVEGLLKIWHHAAGHRTITNAFISPEPEFCRALIDRIPKLKGSMLQAGIRMAAFLRLKEAIPLIRDLGKDSCFRQEVPHLIAQVGGAAGVFALTDQYREPVSLRDRQQVSSALAALFAYHPEEREEVLEEAMISMDEESKEVLVEMLGKVGDRPACLALTWLVERRIDLATSASLALARTGSRQALEMLMELLLENRLPMEARPAAGAAAFHLGGRDVLEALYSEGKEALAPFEASSTRIWAPSKRRTLLSENRFEKLKRYVLEYPDS
ncbi:MAG: zf-HC2 domain-containing protein [Planctomycetes bacterium]|nr:zf-HC2 domain-containing protein [Planctomycetota bacterium]